MTDEELLTASAHVMGLLTWIGNAAREAKDRRLIRISSDLYYATNRAWHELDGVHRRQRFDREVFSERNQGDDEHA